MASMKTRPTNLSPVRQYEALKLQIPIIEFADVTTTQLMEPYPAKALQWIKLSKITTIVAALLVLLTSTLSLLAYQQLRSANAQLKTGHLTSTNDIATAFQIQADIEAKGLLNYVKQRSMLTALQPALKSCLTWSIKVEDMSIVADITILATKDTDDVMTTLDKGMSNLGLARYDKKEANNSRFILKYGPK